MQGKITKRTVDALQPGADGAEAMLWDSELRGFGCRARGGGASIVTKTYLLQYRAGRGRGAPLRKLTIGRHGSPWTAETARTEAKRLLGMVAQGDDPAEARQEERNALTVAALCDLYLAEGASHKKPSTLKADRGRIDHHIKPLLGSKRVDAIMRADIERLLIDVKAGKTAAAEPTRAERKPGSLAQGGAGVAAQCVTLMGTMLAFAVNRGLRPDNPAHGIKKPAVRKLQRFLSDQEFARLAAALAAEEAASGNPFPAAIIRLLILTGCRRSEIVNLRWEHVSIDHGCLLLPDSKTGRKTVYLNAPALAVLAGLPRPVGNPYVLAGDRDGQPYAGIDKVWYRVRAAAELPDVRLHDLRHSFASIGARAGLGLPVIGALLGHKHASTTQGYAHLSADPVRAANEAIGARIVRAMAPLDAPGDGGQVIPLHDRKGG
jgi:integrase